MYVWKKIIPFLGLSQRFPGVLSVDEMHVSAKRLFIYKITYKINEGGVPATINVARQARTPIIYSSVNEQVSACAPYFIGICLFRFWTNLNQVKFR